jgi:FkbM family methyltransferase
MTDSSSVQFNADSLVRLIIKTGRWPAPFGQVGRWMGRKIGAPMSGGLRLVIHNPMEVIQRQVISCGAYEPSIICVFHAIVRPGDTFFDVGGNIGHHSLVALGCGAHVHTFEPLPRLAERIRENAAFNKLDAAITINVAAVGATAGVATLNEIDRSDDGSHSLIAGVAGKSLQRIEVPVLSLDDYVACGKAHSPHLIKIDVEGYEARVLDGAKEILTGETPPFVIIETGDRLADAIGESARSVLDRLFQADYRLWCIGEKDAGLEEITGKKVPGELNNYLAAHPMNPRLPSVLSSLGAQK